ncbi:pilus assembly protein TadG-related protein [Pelagibacterium xiamenense]|uniref:pilus assembly protein TadG-related protein n=1 Tax=Pelagibacterium xiamenense TaxID=2901140 RepID=UPI001E559C1F|nr:pilus assembly protein TadG-related protein [Pelagibacterium xiamenense]MCD7058565.1 pilus assembly protein TadG-related protein [Pelagibacterium xiamenense]
MPGLRTAIAPFLADEAANFTVMTALIMPVLLGIAALAVDYASLTHQKRRLQAAVDLAAIHAAGDPDNAGARARTVLVDAGFVAPQTALEALVGEEGPLTVVRGLYRADIGTPAATRFVPEGSAVNAVSVAFTTPGTLHFARTFYAGDMALGARATASVTPRAALSVGSRLASLDAGVLNALLGGLLGTTLEFELLDYEALADLDIDLLDVLDALAGDIGIEAGTYRRVLTADVALADLAAAIAAASSDEDHAAVAVLLNLAGRLDDEIVVDMANLVAFGDLAALGIGTASSGVWATLDALSLVTAAAALADGTHQVALDLGAGIPGLAGFTARLAVGEPPQGAWFTLAGDGGYVRTAQVRLKFEFSLLGDGGPGIGAFGVTVPVYAELAPAEAWLVSVTCPPGVPAGARATVGARPGVLRLAIGATDPDAFFDTAAPFSVGYGTLATVAGLARVTGRADIAMVQDDPYTLYFDAADAAAGTVRTVSTVTPVASLTGSLLETLDLRLELIGPSLLGGLLDGLTETVDALVAPLAPVIDTSLAAIFESLGTGLGEADIRVHGFDCRAPALVQ